MRSLKLLEDAFRLVTDGYDFEIDLQGEHLRLYFRLGEANLIGAEDCGLGLQDALIMLYACIIDDAEWLLIEEPENHLHPSMQRELLKFFGSVKDKTFFLATHSSVMLDQTYVDVVLQCSYEGGTIHVSDATSKSALLSNLGYSVTDNLVADVILMVEGPSDKEAIEEIVRKLNPPKDRTVRLWLLGGDFMDKHDFESFKESYDVRVLIDKELSKGSRDIRAKVKAGCDRLDVECKVLDQYAIENYYSLDAYRKVYPYEGRLKGVSALDPGSKIQDQIGFNPKGCTRQLARETSLEHLKDTDLLAFIKKVYAVP